MSKSAINVEKVGKKFSRNLKKSMLYGISDLFKETWSLNTNSDILRESEFWAVEDVSFKLKEGECLGILGPNGSGKSTLLKMLNGIFLPDRGRIEINGKTGALIQVGAGFHPMLSGRENIYINGAILGMKKKEIDQKFDSIVNFADIGDFLDTPVRNYSSGMYVRLGFSVAVHGDPKILLIDEILSVGDLKFRRKAIDKMMQIKNNGTAIVFVTHDINRAQGFCDTGLFMMNGLIKKEGSIGEVIAAYQSTEIDSTTDEHKDPVLKSLLIKEQSIAKEFNSHELDILDLKVTNENNEAKNTFSPNETMKITFKVFPKKKISDSVIIVSARRSDGIRCFLANSHYHKFEVPTLEDTKEFQVMIKPLQLMAGAYTLSVAISDRSLVQPYGRRGGLDVFHIQDSMPNPEGSEGIYHPAINWRVLSKN